MEAPLHFDSQNKPTNLLESSLDFVPEITQIVSFIQRHNYVDLSLFFNKDFKSVKKFTLSEKNLKFLDDLSKFCFLAPKSTVSNCSFQQSQRLIQEPTKTQLRGQRGSEFNVRENGKGKPVVAATIGRLRSEFNRGSPVRVSTSAKTETINSNASGRQRKKCCGRSSASSETVSRHMGGVNRSENSLNQHIKLKHHELWEKLKNVENQQSAGLFEGNHAKERSDSFHKNNEIEF